MNESNQLIEMLGEENIFTILDSLAIVAGSLKRCEDKLGPLTYKSVNEALDSILKNSGLDKNRDLVLSLKILTLQAEYALELENSDE